MDPELICKAQAGDSDALAQLYEKMYKRVYYLALRLTKNPEDAEDAAQETFLSAFGALAGLENPNAFEGWLFQITANKCRNILRKGSRFADLPEDEDGNTLLDDMADPDEAFLPEAALENAEQRRMLLAMIDALPEAQRECVYLFYYSQMSVPQIAKTLNCSEGTVKSRLNYARQKLREGILRTEERDGIRLHSLLPIGLLFAADFQALSLGITIPALGGAAAAAAGAGAGAAGAGTAGAGAAGTSAAGAAKAGIAVALKTKIVAGVAAAAVLVGGGTAVYTSLREGPPPAAQSQYAEFADADMERNLHILLDIPQDQPIPVETLSHVYQVGFIGDGMNLFYQNTWQGNGTISPVNGTTPVYEFSDLRYFGDGSYLLVSIVDPTYPVDEAALLEEFPYIRFTYHDGRDLPDYPKLEMPDNAGQGESEPAGVHFSDAGMETNMRILLNIPVGQSVPAAALSAVDLVCFTGSGMCLPSMEDITLFASASLAADVTTSYQLSNAVQAEGTVPVYDLSDLPYFGGDFLMICVESTTYPVEEAILRQTFPQAAIEVLESDSGTLFLIEK
ncbi:MAG: RNA polymerase sigma factor [Oscillospiraceae bacterium]